MTYSFRFSFLNKNFPVTTWVLGALSRVKAGGGLACLPYGKEAVVLSLKAKEGRE